MSNLEQDPDLVHCSDGGGTPGLELLAPRDVPLGGPRAMTVRRTLPQKQRSLIGAWCFVDHYGPDHVAGSGGMRVPRHPHTGLATVSWLFSGEIDHRDSAGFAAVVRPGEVNLMVAGRGISHQEFSTPGTEVLHGAQLWYALPDSTRHMAPTFSHHVPDPVVVDGAEIRVFIGSLAGATSPVPTHTPPLLGAEITLSPGARVELAVDPGNEHGVLLDSGDLRLGGTQVPRDHLAHVPTGRTQLVLEAGREPVRLLLLGGRPLGEQIVMWWNFVGRDHDEIAAHRAAWQAEIGAEAGERGAPPRFGTFPDGMPAPLPAPDLPGVRLRPRG
ncbi:pirin family protein [Kineococcus endophyticus]|uniref:Pirin family protein n=1 Tax=Kineococcus endophyticus TaxID=1181883 RepID=A0ABV3PBZ0_9ACTN